MAETLVNSYGPIAFGLIAVLILWARIVAPTITNASASAEKLAAGMADLRAASTNLQQVIADLRGIRMQNGRLGLATDDPPTYTGPQSAAGGGTRL